MTKAPFRLLQEMLEGMPAPADPETAGQRLAAALAVRRRAVWEADMMALCIGQAQLGVALGGGMEAVYA